MKILSKNLMAYASAFVSYILPEIDVDEIILFGSVAREEATENSDIDLFFNAKNDEDRIKSNIKKKLERFYKTKIYEIWKLKGGTLPIKIEVGNLDSWTLKRSIISDGIVLYGKYKAMPEKTKGFMYFSIKPIKNIAKRNRIIRKLFGRTEKNYFKKSLIDSLNGKKLTPSSFIVPIEKSKETINILSSDRISHTLFEFWTDSF